MAAVPVDTTPADRVRPYNDRVDDERNALVDSPGQAEVFEYGYLPKSRKAVVLALVWLAVIVISIGYLDIQALYTAIGLLRTKPGQSFLLLIFVASSSNLVWTHARESLDEAIFRAKNSKIRLTDKEVIYIDSRGKEKVRMLFSEINSIEPPSRGLWNTRPVLVIYSTYKSIPIWKGIENGSQLLSKIQESAPGASITSQALIS